MTYAGIFLIAFFCGYILGRIVMRRKLQARVPTLYDANKDLRRKL